MGRGAGRAGRAGLEGESRQVSSGFLEHPSLGSLVRWREGTRANSKLCVRSRIPSKSGGHPGTVGQDGTRQGHSWSTGLALRWHLSLFLDCDTYRETQEAGALDEDTTRSRKRLPSQGLGPSANKDVGCQLQGLRAPTSPEAWRLLHRKQSFTSACPARLTRSRHCTDLFGLHARPLGTVQPQL